MKDIHNWCNPLSCLNADTCNPSHWWRWWFISLLIVKSALHIVIHFHYDALRGQSIHYYACPWHIVLCLLGHSPWSACMHALVLSVFMYCAGLEDLCLKHPAYSADSFGVQVILWVKSPYQWDLLNCSRVRFYKAVFIFCRNSNTIYIKTKQSIFYYYFFPPKMNMHCFWN